MFESCSSFRGAYGRVSPLFSHPEDAVMILWKPGGYGKVHFMFMSQFNLNHNLIVQMKQLSKRCSVLRMKNLVQSEDQPLTEPICWKMKQRNVSHDSDEKPPKAKAKVQSKKQKDQRPGHQQPITSPTVKLFEEDDEQHPAAPSSNDPTIPLRTATPHSFHHGQCPMMKQILTMIPLSPAVKKPILIMVRKMKRKSQC